MVKVYMKLFKNIINIIRFFLHILRIENLSYSQLDSPEEEGLKQIFEGASKLLDHNSIFYKQVDEKNTEAWKRLAEL